MNAPSLGRRAAGAVGWNTIGRVLRIAGQLVFVVILGRALDPKLFGVAMMAFIPFQLATTLGTRTFTQALIHQNDENEADEAEAFWLNLLSGFIVFFALTACGLAYSLAEGDPNIFWLFALVSASAPISAIPIVAQARLMRELDFRTVARIETLASLGGLITGLTVLYFGGGIFAIVGFALGQRVSEGILFIVRAPSRWHRPVIGQRGLAMCKYTLPLFGMHVVTTAILSADQVFVALLIGGETLGFYALARRITDQPARLMVQALERALFPVAVKALKEPDKGLHIYTNALYGLASVSGAAFFGLAAVAPNLVPLIFGEGWQPAAPYVVVFAIQAAVLPVGSVFLSFIMAAGATGRQFWFTLSRLTLILSLTVGLAYLLRWNALTLALATAVVNIALIAPNMILAQRTAGVSALAGGKAILSGLLPGAVAALIAYGAGLLLSAPLVVEASIQIFAGAAAFFIWIAIAHRKRLHDLARRLPFLSQGK